MSETERREFLAWYEGQKDVMFDNRRVLEAYCQNDVTVVLQACRVFRQEFIKIGKIEDFLEAITIACACNNVLLKRFLKPDTIGRTPTGGYSCNFNYSKKALIWLVYKEMIDGGGRKILHGRNGRQYRLPEMPNFSVDGICNETRTVYEFFGCYYHGHTFQPYRDVFTMRGDTLAERYERTIVRIEQIKRAVYQVEVEWECEFDEEILSRHPELKTHPVVGHSPLNKQDALYGGRTDAMRLHYKVREGEETLQYVDVKSLYPTCVNISNFPWVIP